MSNFSTIHARWCNSWQILISVLYKYGYPLNIVCNKTFDICKIKCMITKFFTLGYVNNYNKNRYLQKCSKAAVMIMKIAVP